MVFANMAAPAAVLAQTAADQQGNGARSDIVVIGDRQNLPLANLLAESELDENGIAAYGADNVGDLIEQILLQVGDQGDGPLLLINGLPANGLNDLSDLPTEAVSKIEVLPRKAAALLGSNPTRRVINVIIKPDHKQVTTSAYTGFATAGGGLVAGGELGLLKLAGGDRRSVTLEAAHVEPLLESARNIGSMAGPAFYDLTGNVIPFPFGAGEIDPALSALAGSAVSVAGVPAGNSAPTLANFAATAGQPNFTDIGNSRTLLAQQDRVAANINLTNRYSPRTQLSVNFNGEYSEGSALLGRTSALFQLRPTSAFSPFSQDVLIARYLGEPLRQDRETRGVGASVRLNTELGKWKLSLLSNFIHRSTDTVSERSVDIAALEQAIRAGTANPFGIAQADIAALAPLRDKARLRSSTGRTQLLLNGSPFALPAGPVQSTLRLEWQADRLNSRTAGPTSDFSRKLKREEEVAHLSLNLPLFGQTAGTGFGEIGGELFGALRHVTGADGLRDYGGAINFQKGSALMMRVGFVEEEVAPPTYGLNDPVIIIDNFRSYDFVRQETVLVRYLTGGNAALPIEKRQTQSISATVRPFGDLGLTWNAEYQRVATKNVFAALPPVNAEVQLAFPDRYIRNAAGELIQIDARPVSFARNLREQIRWGINFNHTFRKSPGAADTDNIKLTSGTRVNGYVNHNWALQNTRLARAGLEEVDLLDGGAVGYGGGIPRHSVQFGGGAVRDGAGVQMTGNLHSASRIRSGSLADPTEITFQSRLTVDVRTFVNLGPMFPNSRIAKGMRAAAEVENLFDSKQRVRDENGAVPERYQPFLIDPLGRTLRLSLRKVF